MTLSSDTIVDRILWREDPDYERARLDAVWHSRKPARYPDGILMARSGQDVVDAVRLAGERGLKVKARAGGHSWTASSVRDGGLLLNLSEMTDLTIDPATRSATVQPGAIGRDLNELLAAEGLFFPTGHCPTIAIGGFLLQGGWGWLSRKLGPACTNVTAVDVVTADGRVVHADEQDNTDLLWAARGAGSGYFGIVTRYYLRCHPRPASMKMGMYVYSREDMDEVLRWLLSMHDEWPSGLELQLFGGAPRDPETGKQLRGVPPVLTVLGFALFDTDEESDRALNLLQQCPALGSALLAQPAAPVTLNQLYDVVDTVAAPETAFAGDGLWTDAPAEELAPAFLRMVDELPTPESYVLCWPWDKQDLSGCALSITGRHYVSPFAGWTDPADEAELAGWPGDQVKRVDHLAKGIQLADENLIGRPDARYMTDENTERLETLRGIWDPGLRFHSFLKS
jgi:FAD/FMN-containing dehydrogenase